ncbi:MAG: uroporphyrinogen-III synthase [Alphaproteobacteria bacterium]
MANRQKNIWITRTHEQAQPLADQLRQAGINPMIAPLGTVEFIPNSAEFIREIDLWQHQHSTKPHSTKPIAFLLTSQHGVRAAANHFKNQQVCVFASKPIFIFCVGEATAKAARKTLSDFLPHAEILSPANLAPAREFNLKSVLALIQNRLDEPHRILHVCGKHIIDDPSKTLALYGHEYHKIIAYHMKLIDRIPDEILNPLNNAALDGICLFSPRFARHYQSLIAPLIRDPSHQLPVCFCLSSAISTALNDDPNMRLAIADHQTAWSIGELVIGYYHA